MRRAHGLRQATSEGCRDYVRLAIYAESQNYCMPCGSCRQFLSEFNDGELEILCCKADGRYIAEAQRAAALYI